jgi:hypothetical protein
VHFPEHWAGHNGPIPWPPCSPVTMLFDFFLWGYIRDIVYKIPVTSLNELKLRIVTAIKAVTPQMLENTRGGNRKNAWTSYVPRRACMFKLFRILQYWFYRAQNLELHF